MQDAARMLERRSEATQNSKETMRREEREKSKGEEL